MMLFRKLLPAPVLPAALLLLTLTSAALRAENVVYPADANVVDVTKAPYGAKGDGKTDDTAALQHALTDVTGKRRLLYFPNGTYLVSQTLTIPLNDAEGHTQYGFTNLQGQSRAGAILKLKDRTFTDPAHPQPVLTSGRHGSADWFDSSLKNLTIDTGRGNPGAVGVQFFTNNEGCARDLTIQSGDAQGVCGLDLAYNDMNGPLLVRNVSVQGFGIGIHAGNTVNSQTFEHIKLTGQGKAGLQNDGQMLSVRGLRSASLVPAVVNNSGMLCLLDADMQGMGAGAARVPAVLSKGDLYARSLRSHGYARALETLAGPNVKEWTSRPVVRLFDSPPRALGLPVRETPGVPWDPPAQWDSPTHHGAKPGGDQDISGPMQAAIDSGATTIYLPSGVWHFAHTVHVRGKVRRIVGLDSYIVADEPLNSQDAPLFQIEPGAAPTVVFEGLDFGFGNKKVYSFQNDSRGTVVIKDTLGWGYRNRPGAGPLFLDDVCMHVETDKEAIWARQLNEETQGLHLRNTGGTLWILGLKTERGGTLVETTGGGKTEVLGGLCYTTTAGKLAPMFAAVDSAMSVTLGEVCYSGDPYEIIVRQTRRGMAKEFPAASPDYKSRLVLYAGGANAAP